MKGEAIYEKLHSLFHEASAFAENKHHDNAFKLLREAERLVLDNSQDECFMERLTWKLWRDFFPYAVYRDLSEAAFGMGRFAEAAEYAERVGRLDLAGDAYYADGDMVGTVRAYSECRITQYLSRHKKLFDATKRLIESELYSAQSVLETFPKLSKQLKQAFQYLPKPLKESFKVWPPSRVLLGKSITSRIPRPKIKIHAEAPSTNLVDSWDFTDTALNSKPQQINRQKSAMNLTVLQFDRDKQEALFHDPRNGEIQASLKSCGCDDFNLVGGYPRKKFMPCMHIYRIAIELGMMEAKHYSNIKGRLASVPPEERKAFEIKLLQEIERDPSEWGQWNKKVHSSNSQVARQHRAYEIFLSGDFSLHDDGSGEVCFYRTTLDTCTCPDFMERQLPCKHIYCLALAKGYKLRVSAEMYQKEKTSFENSFLPLITITIGVNDEEKI